MDSLLVARAGVQPATFALGVRCSMQLSYRATWGAAQRIVRIGQNAHLSVSRE